ncbi:MAG TPA: hypothetical protein VGW80_09680 [Solirubrobacterales bacterium]|jgi:hypothetical protein|nr:hypothetical protein [Solirubrobacterales bacterium]
MRNRVTALAAAFAVALAVAVPMVSADEPGQTVKIKSTITIGASGYQGKVKAKNPNCIGQRIVVLKQKGHGVLSRVESKPNGNWKADLEELNENIKIPAKVFAEVKPVSEGTAGTIYKCLGAVSRTVEIAGG